MSEFSIHNLWPLSILENTIDVKSKWLDYLINLSNDKYDRAGGDNGFLTKNYNILNENNFNDLKKDIEFNIELYVKKYLRVKNKFKIVASWGVKHNKGDWGQIHHHKNSLISGVYYLKTKDNSGDIQFHRHQHHNALIDHSLKFDMIEENMVNCQTYFIKPYDGMLLIFPSNVNHSVNHNHNDNDRYCIAFNAYLTGNIGSREDELCLS